MERVITATEARVHFGELMRQVVEQNQAVIVERDGAPQVVVISMAEYERLKDTGQERAWEEALRRAENLSRQIKARRQGQPLPSPVDTLREVREERDADFDRNLGLR